MEEGKNDRKYSEDLADESISKEIEQPEKKISEQKVFSTFLISLESLN